MSEFGGLIAGHAGDRELFDVQMEYPPVPTTVSMEMPLPERPAQRSDE